MLKNMVLQFTDLFNMTCVYCRVEARLSVIIKTTPSCIHKKKRNFTFAFEHVWLDLESLNLLFPLKYHPTNPERQFNYLKWFATMSLWQSKDLSTFLCRQSFLVQFFLAAYWKLLLILFFLWFSIHWVFGKLFNSKAASRVPIIISITLMVSPAANWRVWSWQCV